jgi:4-hydroxybenzoate polyprenyltransferase
MLTAWLLGGPSGEKRRILASSTSMRNFALCLLIVNATAPGLGLEYPLTAFASYMVLPNMILMASYNLYLKRKGRKSAHETKITN